MSYATPIASLSISGSRKSDGTANASGRVWLYDVGTAIPATVYASADATSTLTQPVALDAAGRPANGPIFVTRPVRVFVQSVSGSTYATVSDFTFIPADAEATTVRNDGFTGVDADGSTTAGGDTDLDAVLTSLHASTGGVDAKYLESSGATARTIKAKFAELSVSVKDFGAKGDGIAIDTTAIQAAINRVAALGGGEVYFPPGTYLVDQGLTNGTSGVSFRGASAVLKNTNATATLLTITGAQNFYIRTLRISNSGSGTGTGISLVSCYRVVIDGIQISGHRTSIASTGTSNGSFYFSGLVLISFDGDAAARGISLTDTPSVTLSGVYIYGGTTGYGMECLGSAANVTATGSFFDGTGVRFNAALTGTGFRFTGNSFSGSIPFSFGASPMPVGFFQLGNGIDGYTVDVATGGATVLDLTKGRDIRIKAITGAGTVTVTNPTVLPGATSRDVRYTTRHVNAAGGAVTWAMDTAFVLDGAVAIPTTDARTILVDWLWDGTTSKLREVSRSVTVT